MKVKKRMWTLGVTFLIVLFFLFLQFLLPFPYIPWYNKVLVKQNSDNLQYIGGIS